MSTSIADYNNFVTSQAALFVAAHRSRVESHRFDKLDQRQRERTTYSTVPIFNTAGQLIASGSAQFWHSVYPDPIDYDQFEEPGQHKCIHRNLPNRRRLYYLYGLPDALGDFPLYEGYYYTPCFGQTDLTSTNSGSAPQARDPLC